jgi:hypothetical protein
MNASRHAALVNAAHYLTLRTNLLHMVKIVKIAYDPSCKSSKLSRKKNGQEFILSISKIG